jgi:hypothetical protein
MLHHRTTNPAERAEHIANREEQIRDQELAENGLNPYLNPIWPECWLSFHRKVMYELAREAHDESGTFQHSQFDS